MILWVKRSKVKVIRFTWLKQSLINGTQRLTEQTSRVVHKVFLTFQTSV